MIHTVFLDCGGTLVGGTSSLKVLADTLNPDLSDELFHFLVDSFMEYYLDENPPCFYSIRDLLRLTAKSAAEAFHVPDLSEEVVEIYRENHLKNDSPYDDTIPALEKLKSMGTKLVLISDADADVLLEQLEAFDILHYFDEKIISSHIEAYKPSDTIVKKALSYCKEPFSEILFVGDTIVDIKTAKKMKVRSALINRDCKFKYEADYHIDPLAKIPEIAVETAS